MNTKPFNSYLTEDGLFVLEVGCAGFAADELEVSRVGNLLYVSGKKINKPDLTPVQFQHRNLSYRNFCDSFLIEQHWATTNCEWINGVLRLVFEQKRETVSIKVGIRKPPETEVEVAEETT